MPFDPVDPDFVGSISEIAIHYGPDSDNPVSAGPSLTEDEIPTVPHYGLAGAFEDPEGGLPYGNGYIRVSSSSTKGRGVWGLNWQGLTLAEKDALVAFLQAHQDVAFPVEFPETSPELTYVVARSPEIRNISYDSFQVQTEVLEVHEQPALGLPQTAEILLYLDTRKTSYVMSDAPPRLEARLDIALLGADQFEQTGDVEKQPARVEVANRYFSRFVHNDELVGEHGDFVRTLLDGRGGWTLFLELANLDLNNVVENDTPGAAGERLLFFPIADVAGTPTAGIAVNLREDDTLGSFHLDVSVRMRKTDGANWTETSSLLSTELEAGPNLFCAVCSGAGAGTLKLYWNGVQKVSVTPTFGATTWLSEAGTGDDRLGYASNSTGILYDMGRVILYGVALSDADRQQTEGFLGY